MRKYLLLLSFLIFSFCGCDSVKRIVPVDDQISQAEEETTDSENRGQPDREIVLVEENGDQDEGEPVSNDDLTEKPDSDESPSDDEPAEKPDARGRHRQKSTRHIKESQGNPGHSAVRR